MDSSELNEMDAAAREAARAVMEAMASFLLAVAKSSAPQVPPVVVSSFDARQTRRLVEAGKLTAIKVGRAWYGRPADFEALLSTMDARTPANDHDLKSGADRILHDELARRGLRLRKTAPASPPPEPARALPASTALSRSARPLLPPRRTD
jgi:hypothetical protein